MKVSLALPSLLQPRDRRYIFVTRVQNILPLGMKPKDTSSSTFYTGSRGEAGLADTTEIKCLL